MSAKFDKSVVVNALNQLGLGGAAIRVYLYLLGVERVTVKKIADDLEMPRPSVYDQLKALRALDLINYLDVDNKKLVAAEPGEQLLRIVKAKAKELEKNSKQLEEIIPTLARLSGDAEPRVKFHPGKDGHNRVLGNALLSGEKEILVVWPYHSMTERIGEAELADFSYEREKRGIKVKSIWSHEGDIKTIKERKFPNEKTKVAPKGLSWHMGYLIYGNRVSFISSSKENYAFTINSPEYSELMRAMFDALWAQAKTL